MKENHKRALETHKIFPYVAWALTVVFAFFVYNITRELQAITHDLQKQTEELRARVNMPVEEMTDFDKPKFRQSSN